VALVMPETPIFFIIEEDNTLIVVRRRQVAAAHSIRELMNLSEGKPQAAVP
jgi:hypothetical protein